MAAYPVAYAQSPPEERNRLTVFFRYFMVIPQLIWACFYGLAAMFAVFFAWFAIVFTGKWPEGLYNFSAGFLRYLTRVNGYMYLVTDEYPPFDGGEHPEYPITIDVPPPLAEYSRVKTGFRMILGIPIAIAAYAMSLWLMAVAVVLWFAGVFAGKTSDGLTGAMKTPMAYYTRSTAYFMLITEDWPPFDPGPEGAAATPAAIAPSAPAGPNAPAPAQPQAQPVSPPPPDRPDIGLS